jgi:hypothetical protein
MEVPLEAELIIGEIGVPPMVDIINGGMVARSLRIAGDVIKIKENDNTSEIKYNGKVLSMQVGKSDFTKVNSQKNWHFIYRYVCHQGGSYVLFW